MDKTETESKRSIDHFRVKMQTFFIFFLALVPRYLCSNDAVLLAATEGGEGEQELHQDIWAELRDLRDMVVVQSVQLNQLTGRVTAAENLVEDLKNGNAAMEARMTAAESLVEELMMGNDAQNKELEVAKEKLRNLELSLMVTEHKMEELKKQQEGQKVAVQDLQNTNRVRKLGFSVSLLSSGQGNTPNNSNNDIQLIYRNVITNIGNHYNLNTGYFTAPVNGAYFFRFTGHVANTRSMLRMSLYKNGDRIVTTGERGTTHSVPSAEDSTSNGVVLHLVVGDTVSIKYLGAVWDDQYHRTTFSGFLLFPL